MERRAIPQWQVNRWLMELMMAGPEITKEDLKRLRNFVPQKTKIALEVESVYGRRW